MIKTKIEWSDSTWSPVTGCYHPCPYCYARSTANRFKGCDCAVGGETDENVVYLKERLTVTSKDGGNRSGGGSYGGSYDNSYQQPSGDFSEIPDDDAGELPF